MAPKMIKGAFALHEIKDREWEFFIALATGHTNHQAATKVDRSLRWGELQTQRLRKLTGGRTASHALLLLAAYCRHFPSELKRDAAKAFERACSFQRRDDDLDDFLTNALSGA